MHVHMHTLHCKDAQQCEQCVELTFYRNNRSFIEYYLVQPLALPKREKTTLFWPFYIEMKLRTFFTADILTCQSRTSIGVTNIINNGSVPSVPVSQWVSMHNNKSLEVDPINDMESVLILLLLFTLTQMYLKKVQRKHLEVYANLEFDACNAPKKS